MEAATLLPAAPHFFVGYLAAEGEEPYAVRITTASDGRDPAVEGDPRLRAKLAGHEEALEQRLRRGGADVNGLLAELSELIETAGHAPQALAMQSTAEAAAPVPQAPSRQLPPAAYYERLVDELDVVGWGALLSVSPALDELQLHVDDAAGRSHVLALTLPPDYPRSPPRTRASLPLPFELSWPAIDSGGGGGSSSSSAPSLAGAISQFRVALARHQQLWDMLDDLDAHAWVLEPKNPGRDCVSRRIALGDHCSLQLELHTGAPSSLPELQFYGADRLVAPLRQALNANLMLWQPERTVRLNLAAVLQRDLPAPPSTAGANGVDAEAYATECAICYAYQLDGAVPESACDACGKPFHKACLSEWLRGLTTTQQSFNRLFGECPYCGSGITVEAQPVR